MRHLLLTGLAALLVVWALGCGDDDRAGDDDGASDSDGDTDADTDGDSDGDTGSECEDDVPWGPLTAYTEGQPIGNWSFENGYVDSDNDGFVEEVDTPFTMLDMHCAGHQSAVLIGGSTS